MLTLDERPFKFADMVGNAATMSALKKRTETMKFPEVMLMAGDSGTGKTTVARIIAALLTDDNPILNADGTRDPNPETPSSALIRDKGCSSNVLFFDATDLKKEGVLALHEEVSYAPMDGGNKIIIIDEAQALSTHAKGATLTLLEQRNEGVYLILCTMNIDAFDKAVLGRCATFNFRSPVATEIGDYLMNLSEKLEAFDGPRSCPPDKEEEFLKKTTLLMAENAFGSVRLAVQYLGRCIEEELWTVEQVKETLSLLTQEDIQTMLEQLLNKDPRALLSLQETTRKGKKVDDLFQQLWWKLTDIFVYQITKKTDKAGVADTFKSAHNLIPLIQTFETVATMGGSYIKPMLLLGRLGQYYRDANIPAGVTAPPPPPVVATAPQGRVRVAPT